MLHLLWLLKTDIFTSISTVKTKEAAINSKSKERKVQKVSARPWTAVYISYMQLIGHDSSAISRKAAWTFRQTNLSDYFNRPWFFITMHILHLYCLHFQRTFVSTNNWQNYYLHHYIHCKMTAFAAPFQDQSDEWSPWCHVLYTLDKCEQLQLFHQPCQKYAQCYFIYHKRIEIV